MTSLCLNHNDPQVQLWFRNVGIEETYRQYVLHGESLPVWNDKFLLTSLSDARQFMSNILPSDKYEYENIKKILDILPVGSQAAFWKDTFYFKDAITKGELAEEAFHAIVSTIFTDSQREEFYREAIKATPNLSQRVAQLLKSAPETYENMSESERRERVAEEYIAELFREDYTSGTSTPVSEIGKFISDFFNLLKELFGFIKNDRNYIDALFEDIKQGKYRNSNVVFSENTVPSTYLVVGKNINGGMQELSETESEQVMRNLVALYFKLKQTDIEKPNLIDSTIEAARQYYSEENSVVAGAFEESEEIWSDEKDDFITVENPQYLELISELEKRITRASPYMFDALEEDGGDTLSDENSEYSSLSDFNSADEAGFSNLNSWVKQYIHTVGIPIKTISLKSGVSRIH